MNIGWAIPTVGWARPALAHPCLCLCQWSLLPVPQCQ